MTPKEQTIKLKSMTRLELMDTLSALWRVAREASNIEDMVEVPDNLGASATVTCEVAIRKFRESLAALRETEEKA